MSVQALDHYFVRANDLEVTRAFYCDALDFQVMPRPDFPFAGYWLGVNGQVQIHMGAHGIDRQERFYAGTTAESATDQTGVIDHIAFNASDPVGMYRRLASSGLSPERRWFRDAGIAQVFVRDPNGVTIELNYRDLTSEPEWDAD